MDADLTGDRRPCRALEAAVDDSIAIVSGGDAPSTTEKAVDEVAVAAARLGVADALLFRRVSATRWVHLGGLGRGRGWAGIVDVDPTEDRGVDLVPRTAGGVHRFSYCPAARVIGPYYAQSGALVRVSHDVVVVLGNQKSAAALPASDADLVALGELVDAEVTDVSPSKRLGDELEVLNAVRAIITTKATTLTATFEHILRVATESLSCELGVLRDGDGQIVVADRSGGLTSRTPGLINALNELDALADGRTLRIQDTTETPGLGLLRLEPGIRSVLTVVIPEPVGGLLVAAHTSAGPRGFTNLCQHLGEQVIEAASVIAHTAALRDHLGVIADEQARSARTDPLTGLGNRLSWEEALTTVQKRVDSGESVTVITLDVDGLKEINDNFGHDAGDQLLRCCADILREHCREGDVAVRLGGDEFALLIPVGRSLATRRVASLSAKLGAVMTSGRQIVAASVGAGTAEPGQRVADAARDADAAMYAQKRDRRTRDGGRQNAVA